LESWPAIFVRQLKPAAGALQHAQAEAVALEAAGEFRTLFDSASDAILYHGFQWPISGSEPGRPASASAIAGMNS